MVPEDTLVSIAKSDGSHPLHDITSLVCVISTQFNTLTLIKNGLYIISPIFPVHHQTSLSSGTYSQWGTCCKYVTAGQRRYGSPIVILFSGLPFTFLFAFIITRPLQLSFLGLHHLQFGNDAKNWKWWMPPFLCEHIPKSNKQSTSSVRTIQLHGNDWKIRLSAHVTDTEG